MSSEYGKAIEEAITRLNSQDKKVYESLESGDKESGTLRRLMLSGRPLTRENWVMSEFGLTEDELGPEQLPMIPEGLP